MKNCRLHWFTCLTSIILYNVRLSLISFELLGDRSFPYHTWYLAEGAGCDIHPKWPGTVSLIVGRLRTLQYGQWVLYHYYSSLVLGPDCTQLKSWGCSKNFIILKLIKSVALGCRASYLWLGQDIDFGITKINQKKYIVPSAVLKSAKYSITGNQPTVQLVPQST